MISVFLRELQRYRLEELASKLNCTSAQTKGIIEILKKYGILKSCAAKDRAEGSSSSAEGWIDAAGYLPGAHKRSDAFTFVFVGVVVIEGRVLKCYPKYLQEDGTLEARFKQVLRVLEKYRRSLEQRSFLFSDADGSSTLNPLSVMLFVLRDYFEHGLYANYTEILECSGQGEIFWDRTINANFALISGRRPYYPELITRRKVSNDQDYVRRLHACILTCCTRELREDGLLDLFDLEGVELSDECLEDFGSPEYILQRLTLEQNVQFNTRKLLLLKALYAYVAGRSLAQENCELLSLFGTRSFNLVWEKVCAAVLDNKLQTPLNRLPQPFADACTGKDQSSRKLIDLIEKPRWILNSEAAAEPLESSCTLIPDIVSIAGEGENLRFIIFDAKYYSLVFEPNRLNGEPGIESIAKQFLYELAFRAFLKDPRIKKVINCFLFPLAERLPAHQEAAAEGAADKRQTASEIVDKGVVAFSIFDELKLANIRILLVPAELMFRHYLNDTTLSPADLKL